MYPELIIPLGDELYTFKTYNVFMCLSITFGTSIAYYFLKKELKHSFSFLLGSVISFIIGARLLNFIVNHEAYVMNRLSLFELKAIGFSFYGGVIFSIIYLILIAKVFNLNLWFITDTIVLPFGLSFFIMRIGCFLNGCCYGQPTHHFFGVPLPKEAIPSVFNIFSSSLKIHPTQLYEGLGAFIGVIFFLFYKKRFKTKGLLTLYYGVYLTGIRWFVLSFRSLKYDPWVLTVFYPILYFTLIIVGLFSIWRLKHNAIEKIQISKYSVTNLDKT